MTDARIVLSTCADRASAETLARALVEERLAACVNLLPGARSIYRWQGRVEEADEVMLVIKTLEGRVGALSRRLSGLHSYELPEMLVLGVESGSTPYLAWLSDGVRPVED